MRIRFQTKDNLMVVLNLPSFDKPPDYIDRMVDPEYTEGPICRRYEYRGEVRNGIPTLHEL